MILSYDRAEFLALCYNVLEKLGEDREDLVILGRDKITGKIYEDDLVYISSDSEKTRGEVERKKGNVKILFIENGDVISFSSDFIYLVEHLESLLNS